MLPASDVCTSSPVNWAAFRMITKAMADATAPSAKVAPMSHAGFAALVGAPHQRAEDDRRDEAAVASHLSVAIAARAYGRSRAVDSS